MSQHLQVRHASTNGKGSLHNGLHRASSKARTSGTVHCSLTLVNIRSAYYSKRSEKRRLHAKIAHLRLITLASGSTGNASPPPEYEVRRPGPKDAFYYKCRAPVDAAKGDERKN